MDKSIFELLGFTLELCGNENHVVSLIRIDTAAPCIHPSHVRWVSELQEYEQGVRKHFDWPIDFAHATAFQHKVFTVLKRIPWGESMTYGGVAKAIHQPLAARGVGQAVGKNPVLIVIPCHRVVAAQGIGGFSCGLGMKQKLMEHENHLRR